MDLLDIYQNRDEVNSFMVRIGERINEWPAWWQDTYIDSFVPPAATTLPITITIDPAREEHLQKLYKLATLVHAITADYEVSLARDYRDQVKRQLAVNRTIYSQNALDILPVVNSVLQANQRRPKIPPSLAEAAEDPIYRTVYELIGGTMEPNAEGPTLDFLHDAPFGLSMANYMNMVSSHRVI